MECWWCLFVRPSRISTLCSSGCLCHDWDRRFMPKNPFPRTVPGKRTVLESFAWELRTSVWSAAHISRNIRRTRPPWNPNTLLETLGIIFLRNCYGARNTAKCYKRRHNAKQIQTLFQDCVTYLNFFIEISNGPIKNVSQFWRLKVPPRNDSFWGERDWSSTWRTERQLAVVDFGYFCGTGRILDLDAAEECTQFIVHLRWSATN